MSQSRHFTGLDDAGVEQSRARYGSNLLTPASRESAWKLLLSKFADPLIVILLIAGVASVAIACYEYWFTPEGTERGMALFFEPTGIFMAVILATGLAFLFERKAEREFSILNRVNDADPVQVIRNDSATTVAKSEIVVGDVVILDSGCEVPADGRLLEAVGLTADESSLTGEPMARKTTDPAHFDPDATFPSDAVMRGSKIMEGHGIMLVTAVGDATECGKVFTAAQIDNGVRTPLDEQLARLGNLIARVSYTVATLVVVARLTMFFLTTTGFDWMHFITYMLGTVMIAVALICVSVPEGLPMAVTLSLAYSMRRMLQTNNLVRRLHACETMGAATVICTDKTGTLTQNRMQVAAEMVFVPEHDIQSLYEGIAVNSTARLDMSSPDRPKAVGNPTEGALLIWLASRGVDYLALREAATRVEELPFSTERKYMATVVAAPDGARCLYVKGAPEIVMAMCPTLPEGVTRSEIDTQLALYQSQAMRTLAMASCSLPASTDEELTDGVPAGLPLRLDAIVGIADPVRDEVPAAVAQVRRAGIDIKIVTGDTPGTAREIGRQIGLCGDDDAPDSVTTGPEVAAMTDEELLQRAPHLKIVARARPLDKKRLVEALQADGQVVAVTGDGTNDAPALKAAQVGLSMGDGTSVAKEASDITIIDNSFASIGRAVMWGRSLYRNIQRFILFQLTVNVVACITVLFGSMLGVQSPLTVTQMLWVNLIMDTFAAMALASLPPDASVMNDRPRRRTDFIITRSMWTDIIGTGLTMTLLLMGLLLYLRHVSITSLTQIFCVPLQADHALTPYELTVFFSMFVFLQFWNMFNARAYRTGRSALHFRGCAGFLFIVTVIILGQILIVQAGGMFFNVVPLSLTDWLIIILSTSVVLWLSELYRLMKKIVAKECN